MLSKGGQAQPTMEAVLCLLRMKHGDLKAAKCSLHCVVSTTRQPWITAEGTVDLAPPEHILVVTWSRVRKRGPPDNNG